MTLKFHEPGAFDSDFAERLLQQYEDLNRLWAELRVAPCPNAQVLCPGQFGHGSDTEIPDTPLEEWNAKVEALLEECRSYGKT